MNAERLLAQTDWLRGLARRLVRDENLAEDVVQDTLVAAWRNPPRLEDEAAGGGLRSWLSTVARNAARKRRRAAAVRAHHEALAAQAKATTTGPSAALELDLLRTQQRLVEAVLALEEPYRTAVVLRHQRGLSYGAIAKRLRIERATARKRVSRGVAMLKARLLPDGLIGDAFGDSEGVTLSSLIALAFAPSFPGPLTTLLDRLRPDDAASSISRTADALQSGGLATGGLAMGTKFGIAALMMVTTVALWFTVSRIGERSTRAEDPISMPEVVGELDAPRGLGTKAADSDEPLRTALEERAASETEVVENVLRETGELLEGVVRDDRGDPVPDAVVELRRDELREYSPMDLSHEVRGRHVDAKRTDAEGRFRFSVPAGTPFDLHVDATGFASLVRSGSYAGEDVVLELTRGAAVDGWVQRPDGSPVAGATVVGKRWGTAPYELFRVPTDPQGRFQVDDLPPGAARMDVFPKADAPSLFVELNLVAGKTTEPVITVQPGLRVEGRVTSAATGRGLADAEVGAGWTFEKSVFTEKDGSFVFDGFPVSGSYDVCARAPGHAVATVKVTAARNGVIQVDLSLLPETRVRGRLVDGAGRPVANAYAAAASSYTEWCHGRTEEDGSFELNGLHPEQSYALFVVAEGLGTSAFDFPTVLPLPRAMDLGTLVLRPGVLLRGTAVDLGNAPLAHMPVKLLCTFDDRFALSGAVPDAPSRDYLSERTARTDAQGRFFFADLAPGTYVVEAGPHGQDADRSEPIVVPVGARERTVRIVLDAGLRLEGVVLDEDGDPIGGVAVHAWSDDEEESEALTFTRSDGAFVLEGLRSGSTYRVQAFPSSIGMSAGREPVRDVTLRDVDPLAGRLEIVLPRSERITGRVVDRHGVPVSHAWVLASDEEGTTVASDFADAEGAFELIVAPGTLLDLLAKPPPEEGPFYQVQNTPEGIEGRAEGVLAGATDVSLTLREVEPR